MSDDVKDQGALASGQPVEAVAGQLAEALRVCAALLRAEAASEHRRYRIEGRSVTVGDAIDRAAEVLGRWAALDHGASGLPPVRPVAKDG